MSRYEQVPLQPAPPTSSPFVSRRNNPNHIPRPPNKFILYRSSKLEQMKRMGQFEVNGKKRHQNDISITVADMWKNESQETKDSFEEMAKHIAEEHKKKYPDYVYIPGKSRSKKLKRVGKEGKDATRHPYNNRSRRTDKREKPVDSDPRLEQTSASMPYDQAQFDFDFLSDFTPQQSDAYEADPELVQYFQNELFSDGSMLLYPYDSATYSSGYEFGISESAQDFYPLDALTDPYYYPTYNNKKI